MHTLITVIQWITSCHNNVMTTRYITLSTGTSNVMTTSVTPMFSIKNKITLKAINSHLKGNMINIILHE